MAWEQFSDRKIAYSTPDSRARLYEIKSQFHHFTNYVILELVNLSVPPFSHKVEIIASAS